MTITNPQDPVQGHPGSPAEVALAPIGRGLVGQDETMALQQIAVLALDAVTAAEYVGISVREGEDRSRASTSPLVGRAVQLLEELNEGPGGQATWKVADVTHGTRIRGGERRWRRLVADLGLRSVLCVQLVDDGGTRIGSISFYAASPDAFSGVDVDAAQDFVRHAARALVAVRETGWLHASHVIGLAQGMLMEVRGLSPDEAFDVLLRDSREQGTSLREVAASLVPTGRGPGSVETPAHGLSTREAELICLIVEGLSNEQIAARSHLSINTVKTYIRTAYRKMGVTTRAQAVRWGMDHGMLPERGRC